MIFSWSRSLIPTNSGSTIATPPWSTPTSPTRSRLTIARPQSAQSHSDPTPAAPVEAPAASHSPISSCNPRKGRANCSGRTRKHGPPPSPGRHTPAASCGQRSARISTGGQTPSSWAAGISRKPSQHATAVCAPLSTAASNGTAPASQRNRFLIARSCGPFPQSEKRSAGGRHRRQKHLPPPHHKTGEQCAGSCGDLVPQQTPFESPCRSVLGPAFAA